MRYLEHIHPPLILSTPRSIPTSLMASHVVNSFLKCLITHWLQFVLCVLMGLGLFTAVWLPVATFSKTISFSSPGCCVFQEALLCLYLVLITDDSSSMFTEMGFLVASGLNRLLTNGSYEAAFPLHEVLCLLSLPPFNNFLLLKLAPRSSL